jgi:2-succinyl-5-enolpyruvyl-6-hydroxy-3-cyclohexene-1-carboxylate synthase
MIGLSAPITIHVSDDGQVFDPAHAAQHVVVGDAVAACEALMGARGAAGDGWREKWSALERRLRERLAQHATLDEPAVAREVVASLAPGTNLVLSSSMPVRDADAYAPVARGPLRVFSNRGVNGIDGVMSTALGIGAATGVHTVLLIGDVACLHDVGAWAVAKQLAPSLTVVLVNNDGGGIFHFLPVVDRTVHFERLFGTPHGVDFAHVAGLGGATLHRPGGLPALREALAQAAGGGLHLIEVRSERKANVEAHRALVAALTGELA